MDLENFPTNLNGEYVEHTHLLSSDRAGWDKLSLIHELEPAGEMPEAFLPAHSLVICLGDFQGSFLLNGQWHHEQYSKGDIAFVAAGEVFPRVKVDREVPLLELFLSPDSLVGGVGEIISPRVKLESRFRLRDPLIQQMGLAFPHKYITQRRLEKAKTLLRQRNIAIALICQEVGFKNQSHFTRVFRRHFKITPKAYQNLS